MQQQTSSTFTYTASVQSIGHYDVVVLGGGPAGACAAIEAARQGAKTLHTHHHEHGPQSLGHARQPR